MSLTNMSALRGSIDGFVRGEDVFGFVALRPSYASDDPRFIRADECRKEARPRCDYCGFLVSSHGHKCLSCGAPK